MPSIFFARKYTSAKMPFPDDLWLWQPTNGTDHFCSSIKMLAYFKLNLFYHTQSVMSIPYTKKFYFVIIY